MSTGQPAERWSSQTALRHVLELGEDLLCIAQDSAASEATVPQTLVEQCELIVRSTSRLLGGEARLQLAEEALRDFIGKAQARQAAEASGSIGADYSALMLACMEAHAVRLAESSRSSEAWTAYEPGRRALAVAAPLQVADRLGQTASLLGTLQVERSSGPPFTQSEIELLAGLAVQSALVLQSTLRMASERWRREQLALVGQVSSQILSLRDLDVIALRVTHLILETFDYYYAAIFTLQAGQRALSFRASAGPSREADPSQGLVYTPVSLGQGIVGHVAASRQELLAGDVGKEPRYRALDLLPETRSEIALPLVAQDRLLGVLDVQSSQPDDFDEMDLLVLRALAGNIALAIEEAQLYQELRRRAVQLQTVYEVSSAITSILDQEKLLNEVVSLIQERFGYPYVHLFSVHPGRRKIFYEAGSGLRSQLVQKETYTFDLDDPLGLIPWVARSGDTALVNDVRSEPRYRPSSLPPDETLSELTVPLVFGGQVLGVLDVQSDQLNAFGEEDRFLFEALADHVAIALRNAFLYRSEVWRRGVADSLREVAGILSADVDLDQVLEAVLAELEHTLPINAAAIWLLDESVMEEQVSERLALHLAAVRGEGTSDLEVEIGFQPEEVLEFNLEAPGVQELEQASAWLLEALESDTPLVRSPGSHFEPLGAALGYPEDYSAIAAPLRIGDQLLGVLSLAHRSAGRYGSEAQAMTAAFASYAAVAIENARLYEDAHEQAWISTVLLQVAEATQAVEDLPELLDTVIRITPMLTGVEACLLYILDEDGTFLPAASTGLTPAQQTEFERWRFAPGDVAALDRLADVREPVILRGDEEEDRRLTSILAVGAEEGEVKDIGFPVLVPLLARGEVLGAFLVEYSPNLPTLSLGKSFEAFFDERLAILQGIAHQTAVAADNIRLLKAQKEEAYVSVALLQVAQAVVSSNELDEALGSIVRITPILVGVKRALIYLWDESQNLFRTSQAYGLPRSAEGQVYPRGTFPLLDALLLADALLAHPVQNDEGGAEPPEAWAAMAAPDLDAVARFLEEEACLLMAFPLSVKGKVLGAFLVEEPDPIPGETYSSHGNANRRLRSKRIEIITGISQQAALAIQNDLLQQETVERERLEREMQLAREIQSAFLPQNLPELPGWDLQVYWRPAREVGGDFYDFFELPGDRLGLVIADVADKGMPAALFMTLVRTLVRATVQVLDSPARVVERVNDLLVPDATRGMFVTLVYAVLDLKTGRLRAANSGHNPPLMLHRPCRFERIGRGGMALGVEAGARTQSHSYTLEPGELLVMYTDGVTEAFSPDGEMFGEERLLNTIEETAQCYSSLAQSEQLSARVLLDAIDHKVIDFIGESVPYDDLTLVVLKRADN